MHSALGLRALPKRGRQDFIVELAHAITFGQPLYESLSIRDKPNAPLRCKIPQILKDYA